MSSELPPAAALAASMARQLAAMLVRGGGEIVDDVRPTEADPDVSTFTVDTPIGRYCVTVGPSS